MKIPNKKVHFNYQITEKFEVGVVLTGAEVKSLFKGQASLDEAYVKFIDNEVFLLNAHIHPYAYADVKKIDPKRIRKLLMHRTEIFSLQMKMKQKNLILVPLTWYNKGQQIKLEIGLARGKKMWEKKEALKKADLTRETEEILKNRK